MSNENRFWENTPFDELNPKQWEQICDGCAQCCAHKLQDDETDEIFLTNIVCQHLDMKKCQCSVYGNRHVHVPDCIKITPENANRLNWIPDTCGYRLLANGKPLPEWHPLVTGEQESTHLSNMSVTGKVISETDIDIDELEDYLVEDDYFSRLCSSIGAQD
ncbi:MAG: YcgN family cysteine cluster protein [Kangiellaceae bacterium]|nr:YcgN family cysteine cluster protein [Kangiellaceae bacterium]